MRVHHDSLPIQNTPVHNLKARFISEFVPV